MNTDDLSDDDWAMIDAKLDEAYAHFEECQFDKALKLCDEVEARYPDLPDTAWCMGLILERQHPSVAQQHFRRAHEMNPDDFPLPIEISDEEIEKHIAKILQRLPDDIQEKARDVPIVIEAIPSDDDIFSSEPPLPPSIWGLFRGYTWADEHSSMQVNPSAPPQIVIYKKNLARDLDSKREILKEIQITVLHELAHYFGLDEEGVAKLGLE